MMVTAIVPKEETIFKYADVAFVGVCTKTSSTALHHDAVVCCVLPRLNNCIFLCSGYCTTYDLDVFCVINCAALLVVIVRGLFVEEGRFTFYILGLDKEKKADIFM